MEARTPKDFEKCVSSGGRVRTISVSKKEGKYAYVRFKNGKSYLGEVKQKKKPLDK